MSTDAKKPNPLKKSGAPVAVAGPERGNPLSKPAHPTEPTAPSSPVTEAQSRINIALAQAKLIQTENRTLEGRIQNRDPRYLRELQQENQTLKARLVLLEKALYLLLNDALKPSTESEFSQQLQILQESAIEFFKQSNIDLELWKKIGS